MEDILSVGGYATRSPPASATLTEVYDYRSMVLGRGVEVNGTFPDLSKKFAFEPYLDLPKRIPEARFELAMNIKADDPEQARLRGHRWHVVDPHRVARTPSAYRRYMAGALGEFTAIKGVDVAWRPVG